MIVNKRKCIGCLKVCDRKEMFRLLTKHDTKELVIEPGKKDFGRSVYICKNKECINLAFKKGKINKYVKLKNAEETKETLEALLENKKIF